MAEMQIGGRPGTVYTETEMLQGKAPRPGTLYTETTDSGEQKYVLVKTTTGNLINGTVVTIASSYNATATAVDGNVAAAGHTVGVLVVSVTASTSSICWAQIYGPGNVLASAGALPNVAMATGSVAGAVDDGVTSASAAIAGLVLTATASGAGSILTACILSFPHFMRKT